MYVLNNYKLYHEGKKNESNFTKLNEMTKH